MFTIYDLDTLVVKVLNDNPNYWFDNISLLNKVLEYYPNKDIVHKGYFMFIWEKLLINDNFIAVTTNNDTIFISIKSKITPEVYLSNDSVLDISIKSQIQHILQCPELYRKSQIIEPFLLKLSNQRYRSIEELLSNELDEEDIVNFNSVFLTLNKNPIPYLKHDPKNRYLRIMVPLIVIVAGYFINHYHLLDSLPVYQLVL